MPIILEAKAGLTEAASRTATLSTIMFFIDGCSFLRWAWPVSAITRCYNEKNAPTEADAPVLGPWLIERH